MNKILFSSRKLGFELIEGDHGVLTAVGSFCGNEILSACISDQFNLIVLLTEYNYSGLNLIYNLICIDRLENIKWKAPLPGVPDAYIDFRLGNGLVEGVTWSGFRISIDILTGKEVGREFLK